MNILLLAAVVTHLNHEHLLPYTANSAISHGLHNGWNNPHNPHFNPPPINNKWISDQIIIKDLIIPSNQVVLAPVQIEGTGFWVIQDGNGSTIVVTGELQQGGSAVHLNPAGHPDHGHNVINPVSLPHVEMPQQILPPKVDMGLLEKQLHNHKNEIIINTDD